MTDEAVTTALRLIKEALFTFGAEGDECIQKLVGVQASANEADIFKAFHQGLTGGDAMQPLGAFDLGRLAARLNVARRAESGFNIGPFDAPNLGWALTRAAQSLAAGDIGRRQV